MAFGGLFREYCCRFEVLFILKARIELECTEFMERVVMMALASEFWILFRC